MKKKKTVFKTKEIHPTRLKGRSFKLEAELIRNIGRRLSYCSRKSPLSDRVKIRHTINSLIRNAEILEGKS